MIRLYHGGGASEIYLLGRPLSTEEWSRLRKNVCRLLVARNAYRAAQLLESIPFELFDATNGFGDEFSVLYLKAPFDQYMDLAEQYEDPVAKLTFRHIAETISEIGPFIRFIALELDTIAASESVTTPSLQTTSDTVERALKDAEQLIHSSGAVSGVDRIHTAFHGYLRTVATKSNIEVPEDASLTRLFKFIRENHPAFTESGPRGDDMRRIVLSMASILDALNPVRNRASIAHPNEALLEEPEAMLVINTVRTLLHYLNSKLE